MRQQGACSLNQRLSGAPFRHPSSVPGISRLFAVPSPVFRPSCRFLLTRATVFRSGTCGTVRPFRGYPSRRYGHPIDRRLSGAPFRHPTNRRLSGTPFFAPGPFRSHGRGRPCRPQAPGLQPITRRPPYQILRRALHRAPDGLRMEVVGQFDSSLPFYHSAPLPLCSRPRLRTFAHSSSRKKAFDRTRPWRCL